MKTSVLSQKTKKQNKFFFKYVSFEVYGVNYAMVSSSLPLISVW